MALGVLRCVMPKMIEAKMAKRMTSVKWKAQCSWFSPHGDAVCVDGTDQVQQSRNHHKRSTVIGRHHLHRRLPQPKAMANQIKQAGSEITQETQHVQKVAVLGA